MIILVEIIVKHEKRGPLSGFCLKNDKSWRHLYHCSVGVTGGCLLKAVFQDFDERFYVISD